MPANLIKELQYAKKLHKEALKRDERVLKQKDFVAALLRQRRPIKKDIEKAMEYVTFWKESHQNWIDLIRLHPSWAKHGGTIAWQKRWIKIYEQVLRELEKKGGLLDKKEPRPLRRR